PAVVAERLEVGRVDLRQSDVEVTPPDRWRTEDQAQVFRREKDNLQRPDHVDRTAGTSVSFDPLAGCIPPGLIEGENDLDLALMVVVLHAAEHTGIWGQTVLLGALPVD